MTTDLPTAPATPAPSEPMTPVATGERVELIDVLRGFAVLGILLVNANMFFAPIYLAMADTQLWTAPIDRLVMNAVIFFAQAKFYTLFALLFGVGMGIQLQRAEAKGLSPDRFFARRLFWLLLIGFVHAFLIWFGDILTTYAVAGFMLLALRRLPDRWLFLGGVALVFVPLVGFTGIVGLVELAKLSPDAAATVQQLFDEQAAANAVALEEALDAYGSGGFLEVARARAGQVIVVWGSWIFSLPHIVGLFAIGYVVGRKNWLRHPNLGAIRRWLPALFVLGIVGAALQVWGYAHANPAVPSAASWVTQLGTSIGGPALCLTYVGTIVLVFQSERGRRFLQPLAPVGRMALTNYLTHSLVFTTIALPWGLGLYAKVPPSIAVPAGIVLWLLQIPFSKWWLSRFRYGPFEWAWRTLTYGESQPMRKT